MKILVVNAICYFPVSGINRVVTRIGEELVKRGHEYTVLTLHLHDSTEEVFHNGVRVIKLPYCKYNKWGAQEGPNALRFLLDNVKEYDVVNSHNYYSFWSVFAALSCKKRGVPFVLTPHYHGRRGTKKGLYPLLYDVFSPLGRLSFRWAKTIICDSRYEEGLIAKVIQARKARFVVVPCGVDAIVTTDKPRRTRARPSILYVGNLFESKGVQHLVDAVHLVRTHYREAVDLNIVGDGPYKSVLQDKILRYGLTDAVRFYHNLSQEELYQQYRDADIFALLSYSEAYGIVVAEALAMGIPCIVANAAALTEFTSESGCFGIDYPPNTKQVAELVLKLLERRVVVGPLSEKIRTWDKAAVDYEHIYTDVLRQTDEGAIPQHSS